MNCMVLYEMSIESHLNIQMIFSFELKGANVMRRTIIVLPKVSTDNSFGKLISNDLSQLVGGIVSDWYCKCRLKIEAVFSANKIHKEEEKKRRRQSAGF